MADNNCRKPRVCRNLLLEFGEDDRTDEQRRAADLENEVNDFMKTDLMSKIRKWNFDFVNETPLDGDWQWYVCNDKTQNGDGTGAGGDAEN